MKRVFAMVVSCVSSFALAQSAYDQDEAPAAAVEVETGSATMVVPGAAVQMQVGTTRTTRTTTTVVGGSMGVGMGVGVGVGVGANVVVQPGVVVQQPPVIVRERVIVQQPVVVQQQPVMVQQPVAMRDCGTGPNDPGCVMRKNGVYPMDGVAFDGALKTLRSQRNTITREEMAKKMLGRNMLTAAQLGLVLDAFADHGITQLEVAKTLAPNVVNPQHALSHSTKFTNSISAEEYVETMSAQNAGY